MLASYVYQLALSYTLMKLLERFLFLGGGRNEYRFINTQKLSPRIVIKGLAVALIMGLTGGLLPAFRAARMNIVEALRAA